MELSNLKDKEDGIDIESGEASNGSSHSKWKNLSLNKLFGRILGSNESAESEPTVKSEYPSETTVLLVDENVGRQQSPVDKENEKERRKGNKVKKAPKPPRPPKGPSLDAADMRLLKEITRTAIKKRERLERVKSFKKMKAAKDLSASASSSSSSSSTSSSFGVTLSALFVTVFFFLVLFFQGLGSSTSSDLIQVEAPQPAPETAGLTPVEFYKTIMSDDGAAPRPKSTDVKLAGLQM